MDVGALLDPGKVGTLGLALLGLYLFITEKIVTGKRLDECKANGDRLLRERNAAMDELRNQDRVNREVRRARRR